MVRRVTGQWLACVLGLAVCGWHGAFAAELPLADAEAEEDLPDMNHVRAQAEAGRARSQTQLADSYFASGDFTNAVHWYRQAADRGHVPAQLSLAGCLISGRGTARSPAEAARVLRLAADTIESGGTTGKVTHAGGAIAGGSASFSPLTGATTSSTNLPPTSAATAPPKPVITLTNLPRVQRVERLLAVEPTLQTTQPTVPPPSAPR
jgi:hypothetical protein